MKAMLGLVLTILIIFGLRLFWFESEMTNDSQHTVLENEISKEVGASNEINSKFNKSLAKLKGQSSEEKTKLMKAEYEILKKSRKKLKRHIAQLKHEMWGLKFPPETAKEISKTVLAASKLLKNPYMLGAFYSEKQIQDEVAKVNFAQKSLEGIDERIKVKIEKNTSL